MKFLKAILKAIGYCVVGLIAIGLIIAGVPLFNYIRHSPVLSPLAAIALVIYVHRTAYRKGLADGRKAEQDERELERQGLQKYE